MGRFSAVRAHGCRAIMRIGVRAPAAAGLAAIVLAAGILVTSSPAAVAEPGPGAQSANGPAKQVPAKDSLEPAIAVRATISRPSAVGKVVTYTYVAKNSGELPLAQLTITPAERLADFTCTRKTATLQPQQAVACSGTRLLTRAEFDARRVVGSATVRAVTDEAQGSSRVVRAAARAAAEIPAQPALELVKRASTTSVAKAGQVVTYRFVAANSGNVTLTDVRVHDELEGLGPITCDLAPPVSLTPGSSLTCSAQLAVAQADMDFGAIFNVADVSGEAPGGDPADESDDIVGLADSQVGVSQEPGIALTSTAEHPANVRAGTRIGYTVTATNTGNVTLSHLVLTSSLPRLSALACSTGGSSALAPGAVRTCQASYTVGASDARRGKVVNRLAVTASAPYATSTSGHVTAKAASSVALVRVPAGPTGSDPSDSGPRNSGLADTGGPPVALGWLGLGLVGGGLAALSARSRRRRA